MKDIAEVAGVSRTTVSFVLNNTEKARLISEETREKVLEAARKLGYRPNELARAVATGHSRVIGLISALPRYRFSAEMLSGLIAASCEQGYLIKFIGQDSERSEEEYLDAILQHCLAGVITINYAPARVERLHLHLAENRVPYCVLANSFPVSSGIRVISDDVQGGMIAVDHLVEHGHRAIGFIGHDPRAGTSVLREQGYVTACQKHKLTPRIMEEADYLQGELVQAYLEQSPDLTAVFCVSPWTAALTIKVARLLARQVPADLSVVGYARSELTDAFDPAITTIDQHHFQMGKTAATELIKQIESGAEGIFTAPRNFLLPVSLVPGESVTTL